MQSRKLKARAGCLCCMQQLLGKSGTHRPEFRIGASKKDRQSAVQLCSPVCVVCGVWCVVCDVRCAMCDVQCVQ